MASEVASAVARIALVYGTMNTFIQRDIDILETEHTVEQVPWQGVRGLPSMRRTIRRADLVMNWFAAEHAGFSTWFAKRARKPVLTIVGGYDAAKVPEIDYGLYTWAPWHRWLGRRAARSSDRILCVDPSLVPDMIRNAGADPQTTGVLATGYDPEAWQPGSKRPLVLTVTAISATTIRRKGLETFVEAAKQMPEVAFALVGKIQDDAARRFIADLPENVDAPGFVTEAELKRTMAEAQVYAQISRYEGLPNALCEAMLCECVPVGTPHCGIPGAIGETGRIVPYGDVPATTDAIRRALSLEGHAARERITRLFPEDARRGGLLAEVRELLDERRSVEAA